MHYCIVSKLKTDNFILSEPSDPSDWNIDETINNISYLDPSLRPHVENFRNHEIDGKLNLAYPLKFKICLFQVKRFCC